MHLLQGYICRDASESGPSNLSDDKFIRGNSLILCKMAINLLMAFHRIHRWFLKVNGRKESAHLKLFYYYNCLFQSKQMYDWKSVFILNEHFFPNLKVIGSKTTINIGSSGLLVPNWVCVTLCPNSLLKQMSEIVISNMYSTVFCCVSWKSIKETRNYIKLFIEKLSLKVMGGLNVTWLEHYLTQRHCKL